MTIEQAIVKLYFARREKAAAKRTFTQNLVELGECGMAHTDEGACWRAARYLPKPELCARCTETQPLWETYQKHSRRAAACLRTVLKIAGKLASASNDAPTPTPGTTR